MQVCQALLEECQKGKYDWRAWVWRYEEVDADVGGRWWLTRPGRLEHVDYEYEFMEKEHDDAL
jgi:hypothetical protein